MSTPSTPTDSGTGTSNAQEKILALLNAEDGDTGNEGGDPALQDEPGEVEETELEESDDSLEESDEPVDEAGAKDEGVESEEQEDGSDEPDPSDEPATVEIDGTPVPLEELKKGYLRQQDYTRKTQELAERRRALEQDHSAVLVERAQYAQLLEPLAKLLQDGDQPEPNWDQLYAEDPANAARIRYLYDRNRAQRQEKLQAIMAEQQRLAEQQQVEYYRQLQEQVETSRGKLLEAIPAWKNPKVAAEDRAKIREFAKSLGYTDEELKLVTDHRAVVGLYKAMKYDQLQARRAQAQKPQAPKVRPMRPGANPGKLDLRRRETVQAKQRLVKSGHVKDAAALIETLL